MLEISTYFVTQLKADIGLSALTGGDSSDSRIYSYNPPFPIKFSSTYPAAIFYRTRQNARPESYSYPSQKGNLRYYFSVESPNKTLAKQIAEYIITLFENKSIITTNWKVGVVVMAGSSEGMIGGTSSTPIHKQSVSFQLKEVFKRGLNPY